VTVHGLVDLHTGLGPWAHGELITSMSKSDEGYGRATDWWGDVRSMADGDSVSAVLTGGWNNIVGELAPEAQITAAALEFGTVEPLVVLQALRADAWLHAHGDPLGPDAPAIRATVRAAFLDDDPAWLDAVWHRFADVMGATLLHLGS
jgi:hypothetical protein